jgi:hypothetical protein
MSSSPEDVIRDIVTRSHYTADLCLTKPKFRISKKLSI